MDSQKVYISMRDPFPSRLCHIHRPNTTFSGVSLGAEYSIDNEKPEELS